MRIAVTGSTGRLGRTVVRMLRAAGHEVLAVDRRPAADGPAPGMTLPEDPAADTHIADLSIWQGLTDLFRGCEAIMHLGNAPGIRPEMASAGFANNTLATYNVFLVAERLSIQRVVYASSIQAYGCFGGQTEPSIHLPSPRYLPLDEDHPLLPAGPYPLSKAMGESIAESFVLRRPTLSAWSLRFTGIFNDEDVQLHEQPAPRMSWRKSIRGSLWTWVHTEDAARAAILCCMAERRGHTPLNIVCPAPYRKWTPADLVDAYGAMPPLRRALRPDEALVSGARAAELIGFHPQHRLDIAAA